LLQYTIEVESFYKLTDGSKVHNTAL